MNTRLDRLIQLNAKTDEIVEFKKLYDPTTGEWVDDGVPTGINTAANLAVGAGVLGAGGYAAQRAVSNAGGYGAVAGKVRTAATPIITSARNKVTTAAKSTPVALANLLAKLKKFRFESRESKLVNLHSKADQLLRLEAQ